MYAVHLVFLQNLAYAVYNKLPYLLLGGIKIYSVADCHVFIVLGVIIVKPLVRRAVLP